ncbi:MAG: DedA family protein [Candidatus Pacebacteria bacterium]|nr:DedA family protein [Candidatus Paceibacterota bacterium]
MHHLNNLDHIGQSLLMASGLGSFWSYVVILFFSFLDTVFIIGTIFPGSILVMGAGFLASYNVLNIWLCLFFVILGGLIGDLVTYYIGGHSNKLFKHDSRLFKMSYISKGQKFFDDHGDKSIVLGRFMGVIKAVVPFIAGLVKMDFKKFLYLNLFSGLIWSILYLGLGYFLGRSVDGLALSNEVKLLILFAPFLLLFIWTIFEARTKISIFFKNIFK